MAHMRNLEYKKGYNSYELGLFKRLNSPKDIQSYLNGLKFNFEEKGNTCFSPRSAIKNKSAHCMEGAMLAAAILEFHGHRPLVLDLRSEEHDFDHVVAVFKQFGHWGAISKTNHAVLRYREPVYKSVRELAMSYFHEYFDSKGRKTLREYSRPFDLGYFDHHPSLTPPLKGGELEVSLSAMGKAKEDVNWRISSQNLFYIPDYLDEIKHFRILNPKQIRNLRIADKIEIKAGEIVENKKTP